MRNQKQKTTTIVKMDRNSAAGQWWLNQSDREFSMEILTKLANKLYGNNKDLKEVALNRVMNRLDTDIVPATTKEKPTVSTANKAQATTNEPTLEKPVKNTSEKANEPTTTFQKTKTDDNSDVSDALFGDEPTQPAKHTDVSHKNFRDLM